MAESREKSQELRAEFESGVAVLVPTMGLTLGRQKDGEYHDLRVRFGWKCVELGVEAGRRDALEEQWISVEEKLPELYVTVLFDARNSGAEKGMRIDGGKWRLERTDPQDETIEFADEEVIGWMQIPPRAWRVK